MLGSGRRPDRGAAGGREPARARPGGVPARGRGAVPRMRLTVSVQTEPIQVRGTRCERCVLGVGKAMEGADGLESGAATLRGQVTRAGDGERRSRETLVATMARAGFYAAEYPPRLARFEP